MTPVDVRPVPKWALISLLLLPFLAACSSLPGAGPSAIDFASRQFSEPGENQDGYLVLDLDPRIIGILENRPAPTLRDHFRDIGGGQPYLVGKGDSLAVTLWEASAGGLFSGASEAGSSGSKSTSIPVQQVDANGTISVPYAGRIKVAGLTLAQVETDIVAALQGKAIEPQAIVTMEQNVSNAVTVSGDVISGARIALSQRGDRILDVIALAGGTRSPVNETFVTLTRAGRSFGMPMLAIVNRPANNILARAGDTITVTRKRNSFSALGASRANALIDFEAQTITLDKAVAKAGGLVGTQSDPVGVFILRREPIKFARLLDPTLTSTGSNGRVNVVYRANLRDPNTLFLARRFAVLPDDILYIAGARANEWTKFLSVIGLTGSTLKAARSF